MRLLTSFLITALVFLIGIGIIMLGFYYPIITCKVSLGLGSVILFIHLWGYFYMRGQ
jgi:hypothetical protein